MTRHPWILAVLVAACGAEAPAPAQTQSFSIVARAETDDGRAVSGASVSSGDRVLATTDSNGRATFTVRGEPGDVVTLRASCPEGYRQAEAPSSVTLQNLRGLDGNQVRDLGYTVVCRPGERLAAVVIRADGRSGLPVLVDGEQRAVTDARGVAHVGLTAPPGATMRVTLDTTAAPALRPRSPDLVLSISDRDDVYVFEQSFDVARPKKKRSRPRRAVAPAPVVEEPPQPRRPVRID